MADEKMHSFEDVMSGSLVAQYKMTHDDDYKEEYIRRLTELGFEEEQAQNLFLFELMILKYDHISDLVSGRYIFNSVIDPTKDPLPESDSWYVEHQWFLLSELVKIWDEAEFVWVNSKDELANEDVRNRVYSLTRYGGGELFSSYVQMMAEKTGIDEKLIHAYARAEQDLLFIYKWNSKDITHPYLPEEEKNTQITIYSFGKDKVQTIRTLRMMSDWELSLKEAVDIVDTKLPYTVPYLLGSRKAEMYMRRLEDSGAEAKITKLG